MELLLNLAWLLLAVPAYWLWRGSGSISAKYKFTRWQCLLALACLLVILFPVISATDDLMAMRTEMEESPISKRSIRQASHDKVSVWNTGLQAPPALLRTASTFALGAEHRDLPLSPTLRLLAIPSALPAGRAPPAARLV
jgi:hypothetical protein